MRIIFKRKVNGFVKLVREKKYQSQNLGFWNNLKYSLPWHFKILASIKSSKVTRSWLNNVRQNKIQGLFQNLSKHFLKHFSEILHYPFCEILKTLGYINVWRKWTRVLNFMGASMEECANSTLRVGKQIVNIKIIN